MTGCGHLLILRHIRVKGENVTWLTLHSADYAPHFLLSLNILVRILICVWWFIFMYIYTSLYKMKSPFILNAWGFKRLSKQNYCWVEWLLINWNNLIPRQICGFLFLQFIRMIINVFRKSKSQRWNKVCCKIKYVGHIKHPDSPAVWSSIINIDTSQRRLIDLRFVWTTVCQWTEYWKFCLELWSKIVLNRLFFQ